MAAKSSRRYTRFFRISLRTLLVLMLLSGLACGWIGIKRLQSLRQKNAVAAFVELGDSRPVRVDVRYYHRRYSAEHPVVTFDSGPLGDRQPRGQFLPHWLRRITGEECFHQVIAVHLAGRDLAESDLDHLRCFRFLQSLNLDGAMATNTAIERLTELSCLERLCLGGTDITNDGLADLSQLTGLRELELWSTNLTDQGIEKLTSLKKLRRINLCRTSVTKHGIENLQVALPKCKIWWDGCEAFRLINQSPTALGCDQPNPADLIRAVNHLHSLGHEGAIEVLREYALVAPGQQPQTDVVGLYDQTRLSLIMPLLFERINPQERIPMSPMSPVPAKAGEAQTLKWPEAHVTVDNDIPFYDLLHGREGYLRPRRDYLVEWAADACRLRPNPLRPRCNPYAAVERVFQRISIEDSYAQKNIHDLIEHLECQAERMVSHLNLENPANAKLRWSDERQEYVLDDEAAD